MPRCVSPRQEDRADAVLDTQQDRSVIKAIALCIIEVPVREARLGETLTVLVESLIPGPLSDAEGSGTRDLPAVL